MSAVINNQCEYELNKNYCNKVQKSIQAKINNNNKTNNNSDSAEQRSSEAAAGLENYHKSEKVGIVAVSAAVNAGRRNAEMSETETMRMALATASTSTSTSMSAWKTSENSNASLLQEMNLARRACWCNNDDDEDDEGDDEDEVKALNNDDAAHDHVDFNDDKVKKHVVVEDEKNVQTTTRTALNGAKLVTNKNTKDDVGENIENILTSVSHLNVNCKEISKQNDDDDDHNDDAEKTAENSLTNNLSANSTKQNKRKVIVNNVKETDMSAEETCKKENKVPEVSHNIFKELLQDTLMAFQPFWLQFVAFCDANTIRHDDPRITRLRQRQREQEQKKQQESENMRQETPPNSTAKDATNGHSGGTGAKTTTSSSSSSAKYKLLTNKKLICLFVVCVIFSCVNRIECRPNMGALGNLILGANSNAAAPPAAALTDSENIANRADGIALTDGNDGSSANSLPPSSPPTPKREQLPVAMDDEHLERHERYPLSQVDFDHVKTPFIIGIWILSASIAKIGFHMTPKLHLIFPESCLLIVVGVVIGVVLYFCTDVAVSPLTPNTFFLYMLPPIILDAGYFMPNRLFFDNLGTILLMAVVGTLFNIATIGGSLWACGLSGIFGENHTPRLLDIFIFASLISAVDPVAVLAVFEEIHVNEILYIVVFGESLLNDAVTVVMYHMMEVYNEIGISNIIAQDIASGVGSFFVVAIGGTAIGVIWGFLTGLVTRFTDHVRVIEPIFIFVMAYLAYLNAEIFHMSGILAITFCGITMKNYVESNISQKSHTTVKYALKMLSSSSETIIFMFLGVATVNNVHVWNTWFVVLTILFCSVFRIIGVIILSAMANRFRLHKLSRVDQFVMSYGGLRGAVAFALVLLIDERVVKQKNMFVTTTIAVIYFTVFVQGITIKPLVKILNVKRANKRKPTMNERIHERFMDHLMAGIEDIVGKTGNYNVRDKFKRFDNRFIRPLLIRDLQGAEPKIIETYSKLTMRDAMEVMRRNPSTIGQMTGTESMSALFRNYTNNYIGGSPSLTNLDNTCSRNLDMHELDYNPSKKDLTDAKIHHLLAEELKPYRRHRRLSYSRHAVDDRDLSTQVNYKMQMNFRRMFNDRKHHKRSKRGANNKQQEGVKQNHVSFHDFQQNGTTKQLSNEESAQQKANDINAVCNADDWEEGLTFTAKSSPDSDRANNNSLIAHIQNLPGFDASKARIVQHYAPKVGCDSEQSSPEKLLSPDPTFGPTAAELILPWRRDRSYQSIVAENPIPEEDRNISRDSDGERRVATPTATESQLPWKRQGDEISDAIQQNEFPAWASNKEYLAYNSPSATFLGGINKPKQPKSVIGLFRRESSSSKGGISGSGGIDLTGSAGGDAGSARGSDPTLAVVLTAMVPPTGSLVGHNPRLDKRSQSISMGSAAAHVIGSETHSGPFPVTASHRRNVRRGSMLELSGDTIPEESYHPHGHSKSLCEPAGDDWDTDTAPLASTNSEKLMRNGREPLLPKLTPRAQIRRMGAGAVGGVAVGVPGCKNQVTTALLSTTNSDFDDDDDEEDEDEDEDFDLYDDENIVVTTLTTPAPMATPRAQNRNAAAAGGTSASMPATTTTTTTIRLTRNNDESII